MAVKKIKTPAFAKASAGKQKSLAASRRSASGQAKIKNITKKIVSTKSKSRTEKASVKSTKKTREEGGILTGVYGASGKVIGRINLPKEIFDTKVNNVLMTQAVRVYLANHRAGTASTKTRGEVRGSTRKIYRQKGTGRARHGAIRAPIFVGGGIVSGPKPRDLSLKLPQKMKRSALFSALTLKQKDKKVIVADKLESVTGKTSKMQKVLQNLKLTGKRGKGDKILLVLPAKVDTIERSLRNIEGVSLERAQNLNTYEVLNHNYILFLKDSIEVLKQTFLKEQQ